MVLITANSVLPSLVGSSNTESCIPRSWKHRKQCVNLICDPQDTSRPQNISGYRYQRTNVHSSRYRSSEHYGVNMALSVITRGDPSVGFPVLGNTARGFRPGDLGAMCLYSRFGLADWKVDRLNKPLPPGCVQTSCFISWTFPKPPTSYI